MIATKKQAQAEGRRLARLEVRHLFYWEGAAVVRGIDRGANGWTRFAKAEQEAKSRRIPVQWHAAYYSAFASQARRSARAKLRRKP